ncbi:transposase [Pandoraea pnomenusa]|uniref:Transposase n=1 Tax=Pandoraea pnomenusa TaxID=93220 RepID=A0ABY6WUB8_9BURK|nr:transposase [Pandoraea pnomenusa]
MKTSNFTEAQIAFALKQAELGTKVEELCRKLGITEATFYNRKKKYGGVGPSELRRMRRLEEGNMKLKRLVARVSEIPCSRRVGNHTDGRTKRSA